MNIENTFNINPYFEDYQDEKGFLKILFKPGYPVQARELTQAQSILQNQVSKFSDHIFKNGSRILGGQIISSTSFVLRIDVGLVSTSSDYSSYLGGLIESDSFTATVVHVINPNVDDRFLNLVVNLKVGTPVRRFARIKTSEEKFYSLNIVFVSSCKLISLSDGIFYIDGYFVTVPAQKFVPYETQTTTFIPVTPEEILIYGVNPVSLPIRSYTFDTGDGNFAGLNKKIGFLIKKTIVNYTDDSSLRDPSSGSSNYNAPGADRYKITLELSQQSSSSPYQFVEIMSFISGLVSKKSTKISYSEINNTFSSRTFDESGSYIVDPFDINILNKPGNTLSCVVGKGKAYLKGVQLESQYPSILEIEKARTWKTESNVPMDFSVGNYLPVILNPLSGVTQFIEKFTTISSSSSKVNFFSNNSLVSSAVISGLIPEAQSNAGVTSRNYLCYLHGVSGSVENADKAMIYRTGDATAVAEIIPIAGMTSFGKIISDNKRNLVFPLSPGYAIRKIDSLKYSSKISTNILTSGDGFAITTLGSTKSLTLNITKTKITNSVPGSSSSSVFFFNYGTGAGADDIAEIFIINQQGNVFNPKKHKDAGNVVTLTGTDNSITLKIENPPVGFNLTTDKLIAEIPVRYVSASQFRTKIDSVANTITFNTSNFNTENNKKYFEFNVIDVYSILSIIRSDTSADISSYFELDDGQRETFYQNSRLFLKKYITIEENVNVVVVYKNFTHQGLSTFPFAGSISYKNSSATDQFPYAEIPLYTNPSTGVVNSLANCLDFRHSNKYTTTPILKPFGVSEFGGSDSKTILSYSHYLPRVDRLCLRAGIDDFAEFFISKGIPDLSPSLPSEPENSMTMYILNIPSYTHNSLDISVNQINTKRYSMEEIGNLEKRVDDVEIFAKFSVSEIELENRSIRANPTDIEPLKTSVSVDEFYGHSKGDVSDKEYICSIDLERGELKPFFDSKPIVLNKNNVSVSDGGAISDDGLITLQYDSIPYIENVYWNNKIVVNPLIGDWLGFAKIQDNVQPYYDDSSRPIVKSNTLNESDNWIGSNALNGNGFGTQWNDWETLWTGKNNILEERDDILNRLFSLSHVSSDSVVDNTNTGSVISSVSRNMNSFSSPSALLRSSRLRNRHRKIIGTATIDTTISHFIPKNENVTIKAQGLKPMTSGLRIYFDGILVTSSPETITTDINGSCEASFTIPSDTFSRGSKIVRISDSPVSYNASTSAETFYFCAGVLEKGTNNTPSTRPLEIRRQSVDSEIISYDVFKRNIGSQNTQWVDPLSQTFFVDSNINPQGITILDVALYFASKDSELPVTIQIRPTEFGYPSLSYVIPFSTVTKLPSDVYIGSDAPGQQTIFTFSSPLYLAPGEYSICIITNSSLYSLHASDSTTQSNVLFGTDGGVDQLVGTLFRATSVGEIVPQNTLDIMFRINRCAFSQTQASIVTEILDNIPDSQILKSSVSSIIPSGCEIDYRVDSSSTEIIFNTTENHYFDVLPTSPASIRLKLKRAEQNSVSPIVDINTFSCFCVSMKDQSSYITKVISLDSSVSNGLVVFTDASVPIKSTVSLQYRILKSGETDIFSKEWLAMPQITNTSSSASDIDFKETMYRVSNLDTFSQYQIRLNISVQTPFVYSDAATIRNIKIVSFIE